jgi:hypothetical protein
MAGKAVVVVMTVVVLGLAPMCGGSQTRPANGGEKQAAVAPAPAPRPGGFASTGSFLVPPATPGEYRTSVQGCLAGGKEAAKGTRSRRSGRQADEIRVHALGTGIVVNHLLTHTCCLEASVTSTVEGNTVRIREELFGKPCRCMCRSTIRTAVALTPGDYRVQVDLFAHGESKRVHEEDVSVKRLRGN